MKSSPIVVTVAALLLSLLSSAPATAGPEGVTKMRVDVPGPEGVEPSLRSETREKISERVVEHVRQRMRAAGVKFSTVAAVDPSTVEVGVEAEYGRELLRGLALAPGRLRVRVVRHVGSEWQERATELPEGVEIRQEGSEIDPDRAFLWSSEHSVLVDVLGDVSFDDIDVYPYSTERGWRSYALGRVVVTEAEVEGTSIERMPTGPPYVAVELSSEGRKEFRRVTKRLGGPLAVVLDGEIVGFLEPSSLTEGSLHLSAPDQVAGDDALTEWARQVAGRLAAPLPEKLVEVEE